MIQILQITSVILSFTGFGAAGPLWRNNVHIYEKRRDASPKTTQTSDTLPHSIIAMNERQDTLFTIPDFEPSATVTLTEFEPSFPLSIPTVEPSATVTLTEFEPSSPVTVAESEPSFPATIPPPEASSAVEIELIPRLDDILTSSGFGASEASQVTTVEINPPLILAPTSHTVITTSSYLATPTTLAAVVSNNSSFAPSNTPPTANLTAPASTSYQSLGTTTQSQSATASATSTSYSRFTLNNTSLITPIPAATSVSTILTISLSSLNLTTTIPSSNTSTSLAALSLTTSLSNSSLPTVPTTPITQIPTIISQPPTSTSLTPAELASNLATAKEYNALFSTLNFSSPCAPNEIACIAGNIGNCDSEGSFVMSICAQGKSCLALPMSDTNGVYVGCTDTSSADAVLGISSSAVSTSVPLIETTIATTPTVSFQSTTPSTLTITISPTYVSTLYVTEQTRSATSTPGSLDSTLFTITVLPPTSVQQATATVTVTVTTTEAVAEASGGL